MSIFTLLEPDDFSNGPYIIFLISHAGLQRNIIIIICCDKILILAACELSFIVYSNRIVLDLSKNFDMTQAIYLFSNDALIIMKVSILTVGLAVRNPYCLSYWRWSLM